MNASPNVSKVAALMGDSARSTILCVLLDKRARTASELAYMAGITPQTASSHLSKLVNGELLTVEKQGRHRYYRLANRQVAAALEALQVVTAANVKRPLQPGPKDKVLRDGRMCYDHLAGSLGVKITHSLVKNGSIVESGKNFDLTRKGEKFLTEFGIDLVQARNKRRKFSQTCLDWSERQPHLAGALGAAISDELMNLKWIRRVKDSRAIQTTPIGRRQLENVFKINF